MKQIKIAICEKLISVFLQDGFFNFPKSNVGVHSHNFAEIHLVLDGTINFYIENSIYSLTKNQAIIIPKTYKHFFKIAGKSASSTAFQVDVQAAEPSTCFVPENLSKLIADEISAVKQSGNYNVLSGLLSSLCCMSVNAEYNGSSQENPDFIIKEFFSHNYMHDVKTSDLANVLHFSARHTERIVKAVTGMTFKENIIHERKLAYEYLKKYTELSNIEISEAIGYKTYSGFYKMIDKKQSEE